MGLLLINIFALAVATIRSLTIKVSLRGGGTGINPKHKGVSMITTLRHVSATIFGRHQVVIMQSLSTLSTLSTISPPLANVYNWRRSCCLQFRFLVIVKVKR
jgi:hypothetical protein